MYFASSNETKTKIFKLHIMSVEAILTFSRIRLIIDNKSVYGENLIRI